MTTLLYLKCLDKRRDQILKDLNAERDPSLHLEWSTHESTVNNTNSYYSAHHVIDRCYVTDSTEKTIEADTKYYINVASFGVWNKKNLPEKKVGEKESKRLSLPKLLNMEQTTTGIFPVKYIIP